MKLLWRAAVLLLALALLTTCEDHAHLRDSLTVVFCFDDGDGTIFSVAQPVLQAHGFKGTLFVNSGYVGVGQKMTWSQLDTLVLAHGWELGGHTRTHANLPGCTDEEAWDEIVGDYEEFAGRGYAPCSFALPCGAASVRDLEYIRSRYRNIRNSNDIEMHAPVDRCNVGYYSYWSDYTPAQLVARVERGIERRESLIVLGFHTFKDSSAGLVTNCHPEDFATIVDYIASLDARVLTLRQALDEQAR